MSLLSVVIPVFNEQESISETLSRLKAIQKQFQEVNIEYIFVDDGSKDLSLKYLKERSLSDESIKIVSLSRNFGHQIAISAGIDKAKGDFIAIIDADLQDPPELLFDMYCLIKQGNDIVYGQRKSRAGESTFKKSTAHLFYKFMNYMCNVDIPLDTGDFRIITKKVADVFRSMPERHRFVRGMIPWLGFKAAAFEYDRDVRFAGTTKYPFFKMLDLAFNAILSFSSKPLSLAINIGIASVILSIIGGIYFLYVKLFTSISVPGITAVLLLMIFIGGTQIFLLGVVGQYIARIFEESKGRPLYVINETVNID